MDTRVFYSTQHIAVGPEGFSLTSWDLIPVISGPECSNTHGISNNSSFSSSTASIYKVKQIYKTNFTV
jgi:hypothetical protein